jgi:hypothetical protein
VPPPGSVHTCQIVGWCAALALDTPTTPGAAPADRWRDADDARDDHATPRNEGCQPARRHDGVFPMPPRLFDGARHAIAVTHDGQPIPARLASFQFAMDVVELERTAGRIKGSARLLGDRCPNLELALVSQTSLVSIARMKAGTNPGEIDFDFESRVRPTDCSPSWRSRRGSCRMPGCFHWRAMPHSRHVREACGAWRHSPVRCPGCQQTTCVCSTTR